MLSLMQTAELLQGSFSGDANLHFLRVTTDSRDVKPGDLFIALQGDTFDGHDFAQQAFTQGAVAVMAHKSLPDFSGNLIQVSNTRRALTQLAAFWRRRFSIPVIAVTGSNGKTTVKEMIAAILAAAYGESGRLATQGNLNNDIGVPLTLLRLNQQHQAAVIELGMNHPGEIAELAQITQPTVALVNNAQREHQEFMHSIEAVANENGSVFSFLPESGIAVFPADSDYVALWRDLACGKKIMTFGLTGAADVFAQTTGTGGLTLSIAGVPWPAAIPLQILGEHNILNAAAAAACTHAAGVSTAAIAQGLAAFKPVAGRLVLKRLPQGTVLVDDTYNANPDSVRAAIEVLANLPRPTLLVLGDMGEVGQQGPEFHAEVGAYAKQKGIGRLMTVGEASRYAAQAYGAGAQHFPTVAEAQSVLDESDLGGSILVKGSRFMKMERIVAALCAGEEKNVA
ncbi:MAG: UDP-N-acetylmuramoyl-tripeptide--D-alanyl-D-alanine ligase [Burkholderiales bacterium]|jgi:UDP-N-acetylmuramoyl-tripeptide--D-alanyl-D-alanine ligase